MDNVTFSFPSLKEYSPIEKRWQIENIGKYKVILTIDGVSEELEYEIIEKVENPYTADKPSKRYIFLILYAVLIIGVYALYNKKIKKQHYEI